MNTPQEDRFIALTQLQLDQAEAKRKAEAARKMAEAKQYVAEPRHIAHGDNIDSSQLSPQPKLVKSLAETASRDKNIALQAKIDRLESKVQYSHTRAISVDKEVATLNDKCNRYHQELYMARETINVLRNIMVNTASIKTQLEATVDSLTHEVVELRAHIANSDSADDAAELIQLSELYNDLLDRHQSACAIHESADLAYNRIDAEKTCEIKLLREKQKLLESQLNNTIITFEPITLRDLVKLDNAL
tara:strand:+ start:1284 stop:2024 length:741 start_codon:yes stop_codon:yes gene_type:complete